MKKTLCIFTGILMFSLLLVFTASAINVNLNVEVVNETGFWQDSGWITFNLSSWAFWNQNMKSLYLQTVLKAGPTNRTGQTIVLSIRPFQDDNNKRSHIINLCDHSWGDGSVQYIWCPNNSTGKFEYKIICSEGQWNGTRADIEIRVRGYDYDFADVIAVD